MALKACKECGKEVSSDVTACPNCGKKNPHGKTSVIAVLGLGILIMCIWSGIAGALRGGDSDHGSRASGSGAESTAVAAQPALAVDNRTLWSAYEDNEVAADNVYKGKRLLVSGSVASISKSLFDDVVIHLASPNQFMTTMATMEKSESSTAAAMRKGQKVAVLCTGKGRVVGSPSLSDCTFASATP